MQMQVAFYHIARKEFLTGTVLCRELLKGINSYKISYTYGKDKLVAIVSPKNVIPFDK